MVSFDVTTHAGNANSTVVAEDGVPDKYIWQPRPINIWVGMNPSNYLQLHVLRAIQQRLRSQECNFVQVPGEKTELGPVADLGIGFGANLREEIRPSAVYGRLPKPRGTVLMITAVESIPDTDLFDLARGQLVKKACHLGILVEGAHMGFGVFLQPPKILQRSGLGALHLFSQRLFCRCFCHGLECYFHGITELGAVRMVRGLFRSAAAFPRAPSRFDFPLE